MIGEKLGPFLIEEKLGSGAMGVVYRATWDVNSQAVAIKVIHQDHATKANAAERFDRESDILKQFRHPNIVRHIGVGFSKARGIRYYAMEYVPGTTLEHVLEERGSLPWTEVVTLGIQIAEALQYAHERGVVHRDLKPSNLMITQRGQIKLTDFGIAKDLDRTALTADGRTLGTAAYMAPEQIRGTPEISHKTDLYALGCLLYQMLTGETPFEGKSAMVLMHKHLDEPAPRPSAKNPEIPLALDKLVVQLMAKDRDDRPWDAQVVAQALTELRDKQLKNEPIPMVFGDVAANPTRLGTSTPTVPAATGQTTRSRKPRKGQGRGESASKTETGAASGARLEVLGLIAGLIVVGGLIAYLLWPPSAEYLYRKARSAMESNLRADWVYARENYFAELDRRFPDHPYKDDLRAWRDRILLGDIERRARILESPALTALTEPQNRAEDLYLRVFKDTRPMLDDGNDEEVIARWREASRALGHDPADENERGWSLLASKRADEIQAKIDERRKLAEARLAEAEQAFGSGRFDRAVELLDGIDRDFGKFTHLREVHEKVTRLRRAMGVGAAGPDVDFPNTPEGALRAYLFARATGNAESLLGAVRPGSLSDADATAIRRPPLPSERIGEIRSMIERLTPIRTLKPGDEVILADGGTFRVGPDDVTEDRAVVAPLTLVGFATRVERLDGRWVVDPETAPDFLTNSLDGLIPSEEPAPTLRNPSTGPRSGTPDAPPGTGG